MTERKRQSIRLPTYDYSSPGAYFVTICTSGRRALFGEIVDGKVRLTSCGEIVQDEWEKTPHLRVDVFLGPFVVMPNHMHGIIWIAKKPDIVDAKWQTAFAAHHVGAQRAAPL